MKPIFYIDRLTKQKKEEKIYGFTFLYLLYGRYPGSRFFNEFLKYFVKFSLLSKGYGFFQKLSISRYKIKPFIKKFHINVSEFEKPTEAFTSFNDFFIRKLKKSVRPVESHPDAAVIPADGRYLFFQKISKNQGFYVKSARFSLEHFLQDRELAERYENGTMVIARLCPTDYHRYHFPCNCIPEKPRLINGYLQSVNLTSLHKNIHIFSENKRYLTPLNTEKFGLVTYCEIGATCVGSIHQTSSPGQWYPKGAEKGFFSFGGSSVILLFEPERISLAPDLLQAPPYTEIFCRFGQLLGMSV